MVQQIDRINGLVGELGIKAPVRVATTANITLSGLQTIDGVVLAAGDRVLVKDQTAGAENGIYAASATTWLREPDWDGARDAVSGTAVKVQEGTQAVIWAVSTTGTITVGTTAVSFERFFSAADIANTPSGSVASTNLQDAVNELAADMSAADNLKVSKTSDTGSAILPSGTTAQRDGTPAAGYTRFNSSYAKPEVYNGTAWTGLGGANGNGGDAVFYENDQTVTTDYTIAANKNAMSAGPITVNSGVTVTVSSGAVWTIV